MNLNTIQMMDKEQLRKTLDQSGYVEIAQMMGQLNLNGREFLATTEFQTINWKITPFQRKQLFSFMKQLKNNPSILKKSSSSVPPIKKPNIPLKKPILCPPPQKFLDKNKETKPDVLEESKNKTFKFQLEKILCETNKIANKPAKFLLPDETHHQRQESVTTLTRKKAKLPLPNDKHKNNNCYPENEYIDMMKKIQKETINDGPEDTYENLNISENRSTFAAGRNNIIQNLPPDEDPIDIYEPPPKIVLTHKSIDGRFKLPPRELEEDTYEPPPNVKPPTKNLATPIPISSRRQLQPPLPMLPGVHIHPEDGEDTYEVPNEPPRGGWEPPVPPSFHCAKSPMRDPSKSPLLDEHEPKLNPLKSSSSPVANRKPIPTPTRDDLQCRTGQKNSVPNAYLIPLPQLDKTMRTSSNKASENDGIKTNYENHALKGSKRDTRINPILNRPLPAIPSAETNTLSVDYQRQSSLFSTNSLRAGGLKSSEYVKLTKKNNRVLNHHGISETDDDNDEDIQIYQNLPNASNVTDEEQPEYSNCPKPPSLFATPQRESMVGQNNNKQSSIGLDKKEIRDNLALQLASELKARKMMMLNQQDADLDEQPEYSNNPPKQKTISPISTLPKPPAISSAHEIPILRESINEYSDEFDDDEYSNIFNINTSEPYFRNTDRRGAKSLLRGYEDGAFLFRPSQHYFLVLTIKYKSKCYNLGIVRTRNDKITLNSDVGSTAPEFSSLRDFVNYFKDEALTFEDGGELIVTHLKSVLPPR